ncbi:plant invertase/pectin methylesterase inhibitor superfamily [Dorcoceras hygrometricum]|uniref:Plant invertase/pectin methylesterase inhibitor superfamily n=1 Tax=Dorcoceras hygrometricum TaxID=472368 RepID=A0A2Z7ACB7_9LAMI|nr:plant invertase/pectin methylesterase inhibitor superfamily [Dorcoceras hygrometricum]
MYAGKLYTSLTLAVSWLELPLTLAHIIGDVKGTVLHNSTLMGLLAQRRIRIPFPGVQWNFKNFAPGIGAGSDQIHRESGTSTVGGDRSPNPVHDWKQDSFVAVGSQPLQLRNHNFGLTHRIMVKRLATSPHDPLGITDSACKNQLVVVSVQYGPFNTYIPIRSTTIGTSRVARDPITMHTSRRSNSDIACVTRVSMTFRVVRTNQYNQDLGLIHSTNGNHLESPNEGSSIDHQVTIHLHAQKITMLTTNETWYFTSRMIVSSSGGLILILTAQSTRNVFRIHSDY